MPKGARRVILVELPIVFEAALRQLALMHQRSMNKVDAAAEVIAQQMLEISIQERFEALAHMTLSEYKSRGCPPIDLGSDTTSGRGREWRT